MRLTAPLIYQLATYVASYLCELCSIHISGIHINSSPIATESFIPYSYHLAIRQANITKVGVIRSIYTYCMEIF